MGFVCVFGDQDPVWGSLIDNLHVAPESHRSGVGRQLMQRAAQWLDQMYPELGVYLWAYEANVPARRFYERLGARHCETINKRDPGGGYALSYRYVWTGPKALR
jgi:GNAT superfamily N-acetyltransferase